MLRQTHVPTHTRGVYEVYLTSPGVIGRWLEFYFWKISKQRSSRNFIPPRVQVQQFNLDHEIARKVRGVKVLQNELSSPATKPDILVTCPQLIEPERPKELPTPLEFLAAWNEWQ